MNPAHVGVFIPIIALMIPIVAIIAHSVTKVIRMRHEERMARGSEDASQWQSTVERLERRMKTLEAILDDQAPGWRRKYDD